MSEKYFSGLFTFIRMESEGLEEILNKTNMLLMERKARGDQNMFGFFIEGVLLVSIILKEEMNDFELLVSAKAQLGFLCPYFYECVIMSGHFQKHDNHETLVLKA